MKILLTRNWTHENDYLSDMLLHGLRNIGHEVVDDPVLWYMYKDSDIEKVQKLHGRGFTTYRTLDNITVDRTNTEDKIINQYFDLVILSRADFKSPYEELILKHYGPDQLIIVDGRDQENLTHWRNSTHLVGRGTYFKRELIQPTADMHPISFAYPKEKILNTATTKTQLLPDFTPAVAGPTQYKYDNEQDYYQEYARSYFGETWKKGGWDCMRHYEIIASGCVPIFRGIESCPDTICTTLPKEQLTAVNGLIAEYGMPWFQGAGQEVYKELQLQIFNHFVENCTTEQLAKYVLNTYAKANQ